MLAAPILKGSGRSTYWFLVLGSQFGLELCMFATAELQVLQSVAVQLMNEDVVALEDHKLRVKRVGQGRLRMVQFKLNGRMFEAIEQNPDKPSRWGRLAREKRRVVQLRGDHAVWGW